MSKYMQLTIDVRQDYKNRIESIYPKLAGHLNRIDETLVGEETSIFDLVGRLDKLLYAAEGDHPFRDVLLKYKGSLKALYAEVESNIADWKLAQADQALYKLEDLFGEIEWALDKA